MQSGAGQLLQVRLVGPAGRFGPRPLGIRTLPSARILSHRPARAAHQSEVIWRNPGERGRASFGAAGVRGARGARCSGLLGSLAYIGEGGGEPAWEAAVSGRSGRWINNVTQTESRQVGRVRGEVLH